MITIDTLKIKTPLSSFKSINTDANWIKTEKTIQNEVVSTKSSLNRIDLGFKSMMIDSSKDEAILEISSKVLKSDYYNLISKNTIEQVCENLGYLGIVDVDTNKFIEDSEALKVDFCNNIEPTERVNDYFPHLLGIRANTSYKVDRYDKPKNKGVVIQGNQQSFKERLILYNKIYDVQRDKELLQHVPYSHLEKQFSNTLRVEQNTAQLKRIRYYANTKTNKLSEILLSDANPNLRLFEKATSKFLDLTLFDDEKYQDKKLHQIEKLEGRKSIIIKCDYDMEIVKEFIKSKVKGNISAYIREYRATMIDMMAEKGFFLHPKENKYVAEIIEKLKEVA